MTNKELAQELAWIEWRQFCAEQTMLKLAWMRFYSDLLRTAAGPYIP